MRLTGRSRIRGDWYIGAFFFIFTICWITLSVLAGLPILGPNGMSTPVKVILALLAWFICAAISFLIARIVAAPFQRITYFEYHRKFVSVVKQLTRDQTERLLSEYPDRKKIEAYRDGKILTSPTIYVTDNFLFIPGLFLVARENLGEILIIELTSALPPRGGVSVKSGYNGVSFLSKEYQLTRSSDYIIPRAELPISYNPTLAPEIGEQIMAWYWQCDPDDPLHPERVRSPLSST